MILTGKTLNAKDAYKIGLVDSVVFQKDLEARIPSIVKSFMENPSPQAGRKKQKRNLQKQFIDNTFWGHWLAFKNARQTTFDTTKGFYPAPLKIIEVLKNSQSAKRVVALSREAKAFGDLVTTPVSKNLIKLFYLNEKYKKLSLPAAENLSFDIQVFNNSLDDQIGIFKS